MTRIKGALSRRVSVVVTGIVLALGGVFGMTVAAPPASAQAVSCYGDYCSAQDPIATNCSADAYTVSATQVYYRTIFKQGLGLYAGYLELRWSPTCKTNWARFTSQNNFNFTVKALQRTTGYSQSWSGGPYQSAWTSQIYSPKLCVAAVLTVRGDGYVFPSETTTACISCGRNDKKSLLPRNHLGLGREAQAV